MTSSTSSTAPASAGPLLSRPAAVASLAVLGFLVLLAVLAPIVLASPTEIHPRDAFAAPSPAHPFGTDELGRDLLSRVAYGGRISLGVAAGATVIAMTLGVAWGLAAATPRWHGEVLMRLADAALAVPIVLFALVFVAALGSDLVAMTVVAGLLMAPLTARIARSAVLAELASEYVHALRAVGVRRVRVLFGEVLPNAAPALLAQASLNLATALMLEATLSFVGLGVQPPDASWGTLLDAGYRRLYESLWYPLLPALLIIAAIGALNVFGDQLRRVLHRGGA
ncbi:ABC transporter permease [Amycolatopsis cihanbeyliensis]|uniref:Peptide/nickel transport system permease protein n=1 Tax=Amycolatopsis cihanbeyliensis TaxID=1128664 RepID=A0A542DDU1_AMYCI|nr:ABC transporter permease [Amycolatopsis cihanbeyliensis]TQJ01239.1 peptide/nickel transport system permease protein [Amycolatopsis cihanbeyliensis]